MLTCKEVSYLLSRSLDEKLPLRQRIALRMHLLLCVMCRRYHKQLQFLHTAAHKAGFEEERDQRSDGRSDEECLPEASKQKIRELLQRCG